MNKIIFILLIVLFASACSKKEQKVETNLPQAIVSAKPKVTFIELGSVSCIPCKQMQEVMKRVEEKYGEQLKVVFYDIHKERDKASEYKVKIIPTQVFLDSNGAEFHRHEGFYPENEIDQILATKGLTIKSAN